MAMTRDLKIGIDTSELRRLGLSDRMFSLLLAIVMDEGDIKLRPSQLDEAREIVETVLGHKLQRRASDTPRETDA